jgi:hypothetical protein
VRDTFNNGNGRAGNTRRRTIASFLQVPESFLFVIDPLLLVADGRANLT